MKPMIYRFQIAANHEATQNQLKSVQNQETRLIVYRHEFYLEISPPLLMNTVALSVHELFYILNYF